jgi:hypothetical protein
MNPRRPEMADIVRTHQSEFLTRWNPVLSREQRKALRDIATAVPPRSADVSSSAISADIASSSITRVGIGTALSARPRLAPDGLRSVKPSSCPFPISTSCSRCPPRSAGWHFRTRN